MNFQYLNGLTEHSKGGQISFSYGNHILAYQGAWRQAIPSSEASVHVRKSSGNSFKSSILHKYSIDTRDDPFVPNRGYAFHISHVIIATYSFECLPFYMYLQGVSWLGRE